ncbi:unnamed protein product [Closterium sp. NIES-64]|nr:unnamed protein product [Closterium sp. NIES-64]
MQVMARQVATNLLRKSWERSARAGGRNEEFKQLTASEEKLEGEEEEEVRDEKDEEGREGKEGERDEKQPAADRYAVSRSMPRKQHDWIFSVGSPNVSSPSSSSSGLNRPPPAQLTLAVAASAAAACAAALMLLHSRFAQTALERAGKRAVGRAEGRDEEERAEEKGERTGKRAGKRADTQEGRLRGSEEMFEAPQKSLERAGKRAEGRAEGRDEERAEEKGERTGKRAGKRADTQEGRLRGSEEMFEAPQKSLERAGKRAEGRAEGRDEERAEEKGERTGKRAEEAGDRTGKRAEEAGERAGKRADTQQGRLRGREGMAGDAARGFAGGVARGGARDVAAGNGGIAEGTVDYIRSLTFKEPDGGRVEARSGKTKEGPETLTAGVERVGEPVGGSGGETAGSENELEGLTGRGSDELGTEGSAEEMEGIQTDGSERSEREWLGPAVAGGAESREQVGGRQGEGERSGWAEGRGESGVWREEGKDAVDGREDMRRRGSGDGDEEGDEGKGEGRDKGDLPGDLEEDELLKLLQAQAISDWSNQIVLQGFNWESHGQPQGWWRHLASLGPAIAAAGFTAVWLPPASSSLAPQGYLPKDLYHLSSAYASEADLRTLFAALRAAQPSTADLYHLASAYGSESFFIIPLALPHSLSSLPFLPPTGYLPKDLYHLSSAYGSEADLRALIAAFRAAQPHSGVPSTSAANGAAATPAAGDDSATVAAASSPSAPAAGGAAVTDMNPDSGLDQAADCAPGTTTDSSAMGCAAADGAATGGAGSAGGVRVIADVVVNHRVGSQLGEGGQWTRFDGTSMPWDESAVTCDSGGKGNPSSGSVFEGVSNIDHSQPFVRRDLTAWLTWLQADVGFSGFRFDYGKGYSAAYVRGYVRGARLRLCVGEYWDTCNYIGPQYDLDYDQDSHRGRIVEWIEGAGRLAAAFDFTTKAVLQEAVKRKEWWRLKDKEGRPPGVMGLLPSHAVTFVDNHDTGSTQAHWPFPSHAVIQGYAYVLTHPGIPSVFYDHFFDWGVDLKIQIQQLIDARRRAGIHSRSSIRILAADDSRYAAIIGGNLCVKIGDGEWSPDCNEIEGALKSELHLGVNSVEGSHPVASEDGAVPPPSQHTLLPSPPPPNPFSELHLGVNSVDVSDPVPSVDGTASVCIARTRLPARPRLRGVSRGFHVLRVTATIPAGIMPRGAFASGPKFEFCVHWNASQPLGECPRGAWRAVDRKGRWVVLRSPFEGAFIDVKREGGVIGDHDVSIKVDEDLEPHRAVFFVLGFLLMLLAGHLSSMVAFYYGGGMTLGVLLVVIVILYQVMRLLPLGRKSSLQILLYGSLMGFIGVIITYVTGAVKTVMEPLGLGDDVISPVVVFVLVLVVLIGAALGFWVVRKFILSPTGELDPPTVSFVNLIPKPHPPTPIPFPHLLPFPLFVRLAPPQSSADAIIATSLLLLSLSATLLLHLLSPRALALLSPTCTPSATPTTSFLVRACVRKGEQAAEQEGDMGGAFSPPQQFGTPPQGPMGAVGGGQGYVTPSRAVDGSPYTRMGTPFQGPPGTPRTPLPASPLARAVCPSSFHRTPHRRHLTPAQAAAISHECTHAALQELAYSPGFGQWVLHNFDRIAITPRILREERGEAEIAATAEMEEGFEEEEDR